MTVLDSKIEPEALGGRKVIGRRTRIFTRVTWLPDISATGVSATVSTPTAGSG